MAKYEKMPRKMQQQEEKELIHLLPIKDKSGLIPQSIEKPGVCRVVLNAHVCVWFQSNIRLCFPAAQMAEEEPEAVEPEEPQEGWTSFYLLRSHNVAVIRISKICFSTEEHQVGPTLSPSEQLDLRLQKLTEKKLRIAALASGVLADPHVNVRLLIINTHTYTHTSRVSPRLPYQTSFRSRS